MKREEGHVLRILEKGVDYEILHKNDCPMIEAHAGQLPGDGRPVMNYDCCTGYLISYYGLKDNGIDWEELPEGDYKLIAEYGWSPSLPTNDGAEWEAWLDLDLS